MNFSYVALVMIIYQKEKSLVSKTHNQLAGAAGIEPASTVLETDALPLNQAPRFVACLY